MWHAAPADAWPRLVLLLAALVLVPGYVFVVLRRASAPWPALSVWQVPACGAALLLIPAQLLPAGYLAGLLTFPWLIVTLGLARAGWRRFWQHRTPEPGWLALYAGLIYVSVGGIWMLGDRLGLSVFGFSTQIIQLTAIHFHYAGLFFPVLAGLGWLAAPSRTGAAACYLAIAAIPMTAIGITLVQIWQWYLWEGISGAGVAIAGGMTAFAYLRLAVTGPWPRGTRMAWGVMSLSLIFSMCLACLYAVRFWVTVPILSIPFMRTWHGAANVLGVTLMGLVGWIVAEIRAARV
jgi:hypothetical protein